MCYTTNFPPYIFLYNTTDIYKTKTIEKLKQVMSIAHPVRILCDLTELYLSQLTLDHSMLHQLYFLQDAFCAFQRPCSV